LKREKLEEEEAGKLWWFEVGRLGDWEAGRL